MPANTKQMVWMLLITVIVMWCGLYTAHHNMLKATLRPDDSFVALSLGQEDIQFKLLGTELTVSKKNIAPPLLKDVLKKTLYVIKSHSEVGFNLMKEFLMNILNKS